jgi:hypothetical protein
MRGAYNTAFWRRELRLISFPSAGYFHHICITKFAPYKSDDTLVCLQIVTQSFLPILSPNPTTCFESSRARQDMSDFNITACGRSVAVRHTVLAATEPRIEIRLDYNQCRLRTYKLDDVS